MAIIYLREAPRDKNHIKMIDVRCTGQWSNCRGEYTMHFASYHKMDPKNTHCLACANEIKREKTAARKGLSKKESASMDMFLRKAWR